ncbi:CapA family protein [Ferruginibacter paludis]|uniref:CapA family protein n=1 Tax=Ferruginibacter paludis TaxID=1310417 RepID=UPI0025B5FAAF|nr:CapA family protein [Ferruginibacter paludis]MDN3658893.1 CapA family protein [Ferruginibacter paludis]
MEAIKVLFTGDFCPHNRMETFSKDGNYAAVFNDFIEVFKNNDLNVTDVECPLTATSSRVPKIGPYQFASPHTIGILQYANIGLAAMANNHMMDCGAEGVNDTINICKKAGIATVGTGANNTEKRKPFSTVIKGKKIAIINFAENEFISVPGSEVGANGMHLVNNYYDITAAKKDHDFVLLMVHGGNEFYSLPSPRIKETYRFFIDIGADVVISNHTHCFSGYEVYNGKPIFYSLGNFIYDWPEKQQADWNFGYVVKLSITDKIDFEIIPLKQNSGVPGVFKLDEEEKISFDLKLAQFNKIIGDDEQLASSFDAYCNSVKRMYEAFIEPGFGKTIASLRARGFFPKFMKKRKRLLLLNLARCEAHRDVLINLLSK